MRPLAWLLSWLAILTIGLAAPVMGGATLQGVDSPPQAHAGHAPGGHAPGGHASDGHAPGDMPALASTAHHHAETAAGGALPSDHGERSHHEGAQSCCSLGCSIAVLIEASPLPGLSARPVPVQGTADSAADRATSPLRRPPRLPA